MPTESQQTPQADPSYTPSHAVSRRSLLVAGATTAVAGPVVVGSRQAATAVSTPTYFQHGVASGDPMPTSVILWTRVTPTPQATPGSGHGPSVRVTWQVASDPTFKRLVASGTASTGPSRDHTVKVDATGLKPEQGYYYRFLFSGKSSPVGRTRTAPAPHATPARLRFGLASCAQWEMGFFAAYRHMAMRNDLDAVLHVGDYIYEYGREAGADRPFVPRHEILTLPDYRQRYASYRTDPDLQALHARFPWVVTWDDHEVANDSWRHGASNHNPGEGPYAARRAAAYRAYDEWMPVRLGGTTVVGDGNRIFRHLSFGTLVDLCMLDLHSYRDAAANPAVDASISDPDRTILGNRQMAWFKDWLADSTAQWKLVGNSMMMTPVTFADLPDTEVALINSITRIWPDDGITPNPATWDGYTADRREVFDLIEQRKIRDVVFLSGDVHSAWATELPFDKTQPDRGSAGVEFTSTSVTSDNIDDILGVPPRTATLALEQALRSDNPHVKYLEMDSHGYSIVEVTAEKTHVDFFAIGDKHSRSTDVRRVASYTTKSGTGRVEGSSVGL